MRSPRKDTTGTPVVNTGKGEGSRESSVQEGTLYVLCYHTFRAVPSTVTEFSYKEFREQMEWLRKAGFRFVSLEEFRQGRVRGSRNILITMDDGYRSNLRVHRRVLKPMGIPSLLAVYTDIIGKGGSFLTPAQVRELHQEGVEFASHSRTHSYLRASYYEENPGKFHSEFFRSKEALEEWTGEPVRVFMYPYCTDSLPARRLAREAGYEFAFVCGSRPVALPVKEEKRYALNRYLLTRENLVRRLASILRRERGAPYLRRHPVPALTPVVLPSEEETSGEKTAPEGMGKVPANPPQKGSPTGMGKSPSNSPDRAAPDSVPRKGSVPSAKKRPGDGVPTGQESQKISQKERVVPSP